MQTAGRHHKSSRISILFLSQNKNSSLSSFYISTLVPLQVLKLWVKLWNMNCLPERFIGTFLTHSFLTKFLLHNTEWLDASKAFTLYFLQFQQLDLDTLFQGAVNWNYSETLFLNNFLNNFVYLNRQQAILVQPVNFIITEHRVLTYELCEIFLRGYSLQHL